MDYDDTALEEMLHNAHRVHVYHSQREGLSVGQSSSLVSDRTGRPVEERTGRPVSPSGRELTLETNKLNLCWTDRKSKSSPNVRRKIKKHESRLVVSEEVYKNEVKLLNLSKKNFTALKLEELQRRD